MARFDRSPPWLIPRAAYIHVPFCAHHCGYCDFAVTAGAEHRIELYLDALAIELASLKMTSPVETIFIGGGTPTHLDARQLERLLQLIRRWFDLDDSGEFSIEATPESISDEKLAVLANNGVNRVSLGVQSFDDRTLAALDRRHRSADGPRAIDSVRKHFAHYSLDLIFGAPGQSPADWERDIERALGFAPPHVSTYGLTYEKGTPLWKERERGRVQPATEDQELAMYLSALDALGAAGIAQYEVSNHARPGFECRHNQTYWANFAYFGFGVGAARYVNGRRETNTRNLETYLRRVLAHESPVFQSEELGPRERAWETVSTQLRRARGIVREEFSAQTGYALDDLAAEGIRALAEWGLVRDDENGVRLTRRGFCVADAVIANLLAGERTAVYPEGSTRLALE